MNLQAFSPSTRPSSIKLLQLAATAVLFGFAASLHASGLIADGGFESATGGNTYFSGSSIDGGSWKVTAGAVYIDSSDPYVYADSNSLNLTGVNPYTADTISQTFTTVAGNVYALNFWANSDSPNVFSLTANGVAIAGAPTSILNNGFPGLVTNSSLFTDYSETFKAATNSTTLAFSDISNPPLFNPNGIGSVVLDNVNVQLAPAPEPGPAVLLSTGVLALALASARKRLLHGAFGE